MPYTVDAKNLMLDALASAIDRMSLHTASPGSTGANEVTGGSPAYARKACSFAAASGGAAALSAAVTFDVPPATTITHLGLWTDTGTVFVGYYDVPDEPFSGQGTYEVAAGTLDLNAIASA